MDNFFIYKLLSFMDAYFGYNHVHMDEGDMDKINFMIERTNHRYNFIQFDLENLGVHTK